MKALRLGENFSKPKSKSLPLPQSPSPSLSYDTNSSPIAVDIESKVDRVENSMILTAESIYITGIYSRSRQEKVQCGFEFELAQARIKVENAWGAYKEALTPSGKLLTEEEEKNRLRMKIDVSCLDLFFILLLILFRMETKLFYIPYPCACLSTGRQRTIGGMVCV